MTGKSCPPHDMMTGELMSEEEQRQAERWLVEHTPPALRYARRCIAALLSNLYEWDDVSENLVVRQGLDTVGNLEVLLELAESALEDRCFNLTDWLEIRDGRFYFRGAP